MSTDDIKPVLTDAQIVAAMRGADKAWNGLTDDEIIVNYGNEARAIERAAVQADRASRVLLAERDALRHALETMVEMVEMNGFGRAYAMDVARAALAKNGGGA